MSMGMGLSWDEGFHQDSPVSKDGNRWIVILMGDFST